MYKHIIFAWLCCFLVFSGWCASFVIVSKYEVFIRIKEIEQRVNKQEIEKLNAQNDTITLAYSRCRMGLD